MRHAKGRQTRQHGRHPLIRWLLAGLLPAAAALAALSCTPEAKHQVLTFFFDGVPPLHPAEKPAAEAGTEAPLQTPGEGPKVARIEWSQHQPTLDKKKCGACHNRDASFSLVKPLPELCASCHEKETREFPRMHGPVAIGECALCHEAHRSPYKHLVKALPEKLCFQCHEPTPQGGKTRGCPRPADSADCMACHNPHGGRGEFFLVARATDVKSDPKAGSAPSSPEGP